MEKNKRALDLLSPEKKRICVDKIIHYFKQNMSEEIGIISAEKILHLFLEIAGNDIYNKGVEESRLILRNALDNLDLDLEVLLKK